MKPIFHLLDKKITISSLIQQSFDKEPMLIFFRHHLITQNTKKYINLFFIFQLSIQAYKKQNKMIDVVNTFIYLTLIREKISVEKKSKTLFKRLKNLKDSVLIFEIFMGNIETLVFCRLALASY